MSLGKIRNIFINKIPYSMKKLYAIATAFAVGALMCNAADAGSVLSTLESRTAKTVLQSKSLPARNHARQLKAPAKAPEGTWNVLGEGTYCEDFLSQFSNVGEGLSWSVTIEQNQENPGWYRCLPYIQGPVTDLFGEPDYDAVLYINATDPSRVYCEDIYIYGDILISQLVPENDWEMEEGEEGAYGTFADGLFTFPAYSFGMIYAGQESYSNVNGAFIVALPGVKVPDYSFSVSADGFCAPFNEFDLNLSVGDDIAAVKTLVLPGKLEASDDDVIRAATEGTVADLSAGLKVKLEDRGPATCIVVALKADGDIAGYRTLVMFAEYDEADQWESIGDAKFTEGIYYYGYYVDNETLTTEVQKHKSIEGYYRLVDPYSSHSCGDGEFELVSHAGEGDHHHYLYINATDPDYVYIEPSLTGVVTDWGEGAVMSLGAKYIGTELEQQAKDEECFGKLDKATGVITFPDESILLAEYDYERGKFFISNEGTSIELPENASTSIIVAPDSAPEYFNLQGMRIEHPAAGSIVIRRCGSKVSKVIVK